jgi:hypothetical protein
LLSIKKIISHEIKLFIMKKLKILFIIILTSSSCHSFGQISLQHPNDMGFSTNSLVIFTEMFEQSDIPSMISTVGYQTSQMQSHINFDPSVPPGSLGTQSLKLTTVENSSASNDPMEDANILKKFTVGITDSVFIRYYIKFNDSHAFHHTGVWMGGTNPSNNCWPCNMPGRTIPTSGDSAFIVGTEITGAAHQISQSHAKLGFYNYWMGMKPYTSGPNAGKYYGNEFISPSANASIDMTAWHCVETMIKLNNPNDSTGEIKLWINGQLIAHYGKGFPNGTWNQATFNEGTGSPFEGFRWRSNPNVVFNYIWIKNYADDNVPYLSNNDVLYDHIVVAKDYIGPIYNPSNLMNELENKTFSLYPNPVNESLNFSTYLEEFSITNSLGKEMLKGKGNSVSIAELKDGIYFLTSKESILKFIVKK